MVTFSLEWVVTFPSEQVVTFRPESVVTFERNTRRDEILTLRWEHVDLERGVLRLPDSKTGAKSIPLGAAAAQLLAAAPRFKGNPYVGPGRRPGGRLVGLQDPWERIRERASLPGAASPEAQLGQHWRRRRSRPADPRPPAPDHDPSLHPLQR